MPASWLETFLGSLESWAEPRPDVLAVALVGSHARGQARPDSDVDLVVLTSAPGRYLTDTAWASAFGVVDRIEIEDYGAVYLTSIAFSFGALMFCCLFYQSGLIPRWLSVWGLGGAVLYLAAPLLDMSGHGLGALMAPPAVAEIVLAVWLIAPGMNAPAPRAGATHARG